MSNREGFHEHCGSWLEILEDRGTNLYDVCGLTKVEEGVFRRIWNALEKKVEVVTNAWHKLSDLFTRFKIFEHGSNKEIFEKRIQHLALALETSITTMPGKTSENAEVEGMIYGIYRVILEILRKISLALEEIWHRLKTDIGYLRRDSWVATFVNIWNSQIDSWIWHPEIWEIEENTSNTNFLTDLNDWISNTWSISNIKQNILTVYYGIRTKMGYPAEKKLTFSEKLAAHLQEHLHQKKINFDNELAHFLAMHQRIIKYIFNSVQKIWSPEIYKNEDIKSLPSRLYAFFFHNTSKLRKCWYELIQYGDGIYGVCFYDYERKLEITPRDAHSREVKTDAVTQIVSQESTNANSKNTKEADIGTTKTVDASQITIDTTTKNSSGSKLNIKHEYVKQSEYNSTNCTDNLQDLNVTTKHEDQSQNDALGSLLYKYISAFMVAVFGTRLIEVARAADHAARYRMYFLLCFNWHFFLFLFSYLG